MSSDGEIWPEVDELKNELIQALQKVDNAAGIVQQAPNPGIEIEELGIIGLPLSSRDAELLISKCRQSPFGKGEDTIVDKSVRKSWELNPAQFAVTNPAWPVSLARIVDDVHRGLGLTCHRIGMEAQLYKLLIYEPGAFFKPHQDSEKASGMFGTLVICLPSKHDGGKVLLTHNKREFQVSSAESSQFGTTFAAWYADVLHEVEEVTAGHRVVLTYNLIQNSSLPQKAPDADSKARVKKALRIWEQASADNEPGYPPYIIHQLEHYYSKNGAHINMLKGHDAIQVRCLDSVCRELGYGAYLAVYERTIEKDDEAGDEEYGRGEEFEYLTELDGTPADVHPAYNSTCRLVDYDSDDEEADESEHEGYTGNEGAPATYWYRQTVVLLVPPCRKLELGLTSGNKYKFAGHNLDVLQDNAVSDPGALKQLYRLCHLLLPRTAGASIWSNSATRYDWESHYKYEDDDYDSQQAESKQCFARIAKLTLENNWLDLYDRVPVQQKMTTHCIHALGVFLCTKGTSCIKPQLSKMMKDTVNLADKYRLLRQITECFNKSLVDMSAANRYKTEFDSWYSTAFTDVLGTQQRASKDDGAILGEIGRTCQSEVDEQILRKLKNASTQTIAAFVISLTKIDPDLPPPTQFSLVERALEQLWDDFQYAEPTRTYGGPVEALNQQELAHIIDLTKKHGQISISEAFRSLSAALAVASATYIGDVLCPFIQSIMTHEIPSVIVEDDPDLFDAVSSYIQLALCTYIRRLVGNEPQKPKNWSLTNRGCGSCMHCEKVDAFMANGRERTLRYQVAEKGRKHLTYSFDDYGENNDFDISTDKSTKPYHWLCRKDHKTFNTAFPKWKTWRNEAQQKLKGIGGQDMVYLKTYLGENFDAIVTCQTEKLPDLGSKSMSEKVPLSNIDASGLNVSNSRKRKLNAGDMDGAENDGGTKRARVGDAVPRFAEVIDLT